MLIRIVRMTFQEDQLDAFQQIFDHSKHHIRAFPGCQHLQLLCDLTNPTIRMTYSHWDSPGALENYRQVSYSEPLGQLLKSCLLTNL